MPWLEGGSALLPVWMFHEDDRPFEGDPRHALARIKDRYTQMGLTAVVATELEFYLIDPTNPILNTGADTLGLRSLDAFDGFFTDLYDACDAMDIPADAAISEAGAGQFEINLMHVDDMLKAADDAWLFKLLVRGLAQKNGVTASFMAKPHADQSGNGMHMHFSLLDAQGDNIFDDGGSAGSKRLLSAIAGCLNAMPASMLVLAPHANSYNRLVPGAHAPTKICWAYENRTVAIRVPGGSHKARRIEHRVAGGDVNPYLLLSAVLGAALDGIEQEMTPPPPVSGNAYALDIAELPKTWEDALDRFETDTALTQIFPKTLIENMCFTKRQEMKTLTALSEEERIALYLQFL
jgi:glutamine synthetase